MSTFDARPFAPTPRLTSGFGLAPPVAPCGAGGGAAGIAVVDLALLIGAVAGRLQRLAAEADSATGPALLDCAQALGQLQETARACRPRDEDG